ncbi:Ku protein [Xylophilus sp. GOD-11R]|uniref:non-homologous end joining protein Ku n=1 Tax=Xylophilus sp. GOD-11R TaxID=3089814 RepID=UPI00298CF965|nr:Ku protein [Xylophilus sp. GOD-11R]WPB58838.1 Ku protein [Xylophilus sp. GOD-11R]
MASVGSAPPSNRTVWKGAISFGLVHVPVGLYSATAASGIDFDWLDRRTMDPVGYKRINKKTGKEIGSEDIVKGVDYGDGRYVILSTEEIEKAYPKITQTIEIEAFIDADEVPFVYLEKPYYTAPINRGDKVYALLREALKRSNKVGVAKVVIATKQHLAVLIPCGPALVPNLLRWGGEIRSMESLKLPPSDIKALGVRQAELDMALALIADMTQPWDADQFRNSFADEVMKLVEEKAQSGEIHAVSRLDDSQPQNSGGAEVVDLTALLQRSLKRVAKTEPTQLSMVAPAPKAAAKTKAVPVSAKKLAGKPSVAPKKAAAKSAQASKSTRKAA